MELRLQRALRFERLALGEVAGVATEAAVTSAAALAGEGVLSFVWGILAGAVVRASVLTAAATRAAWPRLVFRLPHVRAVTGFGAYQVGERLLNLLNSRLDALLIGAMLGTGPLGIYAFAFGLAMQPVGRIVPIVARVALPVFARVQDDAGRMRAGYLVLQEMLAAMLAPMLLGLAAVAPRLVPAVFGPRWEAAVPIVQLLAAVGLLRSLTSPAGPLLIARGRADLGFRWNLALLFGTVGAVTLGAAAGGAVGVAVALLVLQAAAAALTPSVLLRALIGPCLGAWARHIALPIGLAALMAVAVLALGRALAGPALVVVAAQVLAGAALYVGALLATSRPTFDEVVRLLTGRAVART
jgi:O-antigen/teichoic acid export membrane protein